MGVESYGGAGAATVAWHILSVSVMPLFPGGLWEESNRASRWMAGGDESGPCLVATWKHVAPPPVRVPANPTSREVGGANKEKQ